jgi:hypothetical protein
MEEIQMNLSIGLIIVIILAFIALFIDNRRGEPGTGFMTDEEYREWLQDQCGCVLPEQSCPYCRKLHEMNSKDEELPYGNHQENTR